MNTDVNLIIPKDKEYIEQQKRIRIAKTIAIIIPLIVGAISLGLFLLTAAINPSSIKLQQQEVLSEISKYQQKKINLFIINDRLNNINSFLKNRRDLASEISAIVTNLPQDSAIDGFEMDEKEVRIKVSSGNLLSINSLIDNLINMVEERLIINSLTLESLSFDEAKSIYSVSLRSEI